MFSSAQRGRQSAKQATEKIGGKGSVALLKNSRQFGCVLQDVGPPKSNSISRKGTKFLGPQRSVQLSRGASRRMKTRERKGPYAGLKKRL